MADDKDSIVHQQRGLKALEDRLAGHLSDIPDEYQGPPGSGGPSSSTKALPGGKYTGGTAHAIHDTGFFDYATTTADGHVVETPSSPKFANTRITNPPAVVQQTTPVPTILSAPPTVVGAATAGAVPSFINDTVFGTTARASGGYQQTPFGGFFGGGGMGGAVGGALGAAAGGGAKGRRGRGQGSTGKNMFGQIMGALKTIIDLLTDINNKIGGLTGGGKGKGGIRPQRTNKSTSGGGSIFDALKSFTAAIPAILAALIAATAGGAIGAGAMNLLGRGTERFGRDAQARAIRNQRKAPSPQGTTPNHSRFSPMKQLSVTAQNLRATAINAKNTKPDQMLQKYGEHKEKFGKTLQRGSKGYIAADLAIRGVGFGSAALHGDGQGMVSNAVHGGGDLVEFNLMSRFAKTARGGLGKTALGAGVELATLANDLHEIDMDQHMSAADKERAKRNRQLRAGTSVAEIGATQAAGLLAKSVAGRTGIGAVAVGGIEVGTAVWKRKQIENDPTMSAENKKKALEALNHSTWKSGAGAAGAVVGGVLGGLVPVPFLDIATAAAGSFAGHWAGEQLGGLAESAFGNLAQNAPKALSYVGNAFKSNPMGTAAALMSGPNMAPNVAMAGMNAPGNQTITVNVTNNNPNFSDPVTMKQVTEQVKDGMQKVVAHLKPVDSYSNLSPTGTGGGNPFADVWAGMSGGH